MADFFRGPYALPPPHMAAPALWPEVVAGAVAGLAQDLVMHPVDTIHARLQVLPSSSPNPLSAFLNVVRITLQGEGLRGFYSGYSTIFVFTMPVNAVYFTSFKLFQRELLGHRPHSRALPETAAHLLAGLGAEVCASFLWTPFDIIKQQLQIGPVAGQPDRSRSILSVARGVAQKHGILGLWRGIVAGWATWGPFSAIYFCAYEALKGRLAARNSTDLAFPGRLLCGVTAGGLGAAVTQPIDVLKIRMQVTQRRLRPVLTELLRSEGAPALLRGIVGRVLWLAPGAGITISVFETTADYLTRIRTPHK